MRRFQREEGRRSKSGASRSTLPPTHTASAALKSVVQHSHSIHDSARPFPSLHLLLPPLPSSSSFHHSPSFPSLSRPSCARPGHPSAVHTPHVPHLLSPNIFHRPFSPFIQHPPPSPLSAKPHHVSTTRSTALLGSHSPSLPRADTSKQPSQQVTLERKGVAKTSWREAVPYVAVPPLPFLSIVLTHSVYLQHPPSPPSAKPTRKRRKPSSTVPPGAASTSKRAGKPATVASTLEVAGGCGRSSRETKLRKSSPLGWVVRRRE